MIDFFSYCLSISFPKSGSMAFRKKTKRKQQEHEEISKLEKPTIGIQQNLIEEWLFRCKNWIIENTKIIRKVSLFVFGSACIGITFIFIYTGLVQKHNFLFFQYLADYEDYRKLEDGPQRKQKFEKLIQKTNEVCNTTLKTSHSYNTCLIEAVSYIELNEKSKAVKPLETYGEHHRNNSVGPLILFYAAQAYENILDLERAYEIYDKIGEKFQSIKKEDIALYHKARILYMQGKIDLAKENFERILKNYPGSIYLRNSESYLMLIGLLPKETSSPSKAGGKSDPVKQEKE